jgi:hypothetical protein
MSDQPADEWPNRSYRRTLLKALAAAPVILTASTVGARAYNSMGNTLKECSNIAGLPADMIPPQCRHP